MKKLQQQIRDGEYPYLKLQLFIILQGHDLRQYGSREIAGNRICRMFRIKKMSGGRFCGCISMDGFIPVPFLAGCQWLFGCF